jgi:ubiquinone/menaquinone biosynthesis C-methylase UbiE
MKDQLQIKERVKERYGRIALAGNSEGCCAPPTECCGGGTSVVMTSPVQIAKNIGYDIKELGSVPESSILGVGCGAPVNFADIHEGEVVVDIGSGGGIDVFLSANKVKGSGKVIGIDMTDEMLEKSRKNAKENGYTNVEFRKGDIERGIPIDDNTADVVISNCVINLTIDKVAAFKEIYRILKKDGGGQPRMVISDLVTDREIHQTGDAVDPEKWCSCIDGALTKENYLGSIRKAGFGNVEVLEEKSYMEGDQVGDGRKITSLVIRALKD